MQHAREASSRRLFGPGVSRAAVVAICLLHSAALSCSKTPPSTPATAALSPLDRLRQDIVQTTQAPGVQRGVWGVVVHSLDRDERLFELQPQTLLVPASVAKLAAVATAADAVGWDFRYETTLKALGPVKDGVLAGDLLVVGSGDPTIGGRQGQDLTGWVAALQDAGLRRIEGGIIADDDAIEEPRPQLAWAWDDLGYPAGAMFGALNYGENRMAVTVAAGPAAGTAASIGVEPHASYRPLANRVRTGAPGSAQQLWPEQRPGEPFLTIAGTIPAGAPAARLNVAVGNPTFWFASVLRHQLQKQGIEVAGDAWDIDDVVPPPDRASAHVLFTHRSPPLREIVRPVLKDSLSLYAEAVMRLNTPPGQPATNDAALEGFNRRVQEWGVSSGSQQIIDGSGLSRRDTVSPEAILAILQRMHDPSSSSPFVSGLPVAGVDGTLGDRMRNTPAAGNVRAKTGTMSNIRSLAGYVRTRDGEALAFVAIVNNFEGTGAAANQALDAIAVRLASFSRK